MCFSEIAMATIREALRYIKSQCDFLTNVCESIMKEDKRCISDCESILSLVQEIQTGCDTVFALVFSLDSRILNLKDYLGASIGAVKPRCQEVVDVFNDILPAMENIRNCAGKLSEKGLDLALKGTPKIEVQGRQIEISLETVADSILSVISQMKLQMETQAKEWQERLRGMTKLYVASLPPKYNIRLIDIVPKYGRLWWVAKLAE